MYTAALQAANAVVRRSPGYLASAVTGRSTFLPPNGHLLPLNELYRDEVCCGSRRSLGMEIMQPLDMTVFPLIPSYNGTASSISVCDHIWPQSTQLKLPTPCQDNLKLPRKPSGGDYHNPSWITTTMTTPNDTTYNTVDAVTKDGTFYIYDVGPAYLFNRVRTDTKHRKRAFTKRGYFRQTRSVLRKENRLKYAYALQGIDYEMLENLKMGEIPDISAFKR